METRNRGGVKHDGRRRRTHQGKCGEACRVGLVQNGFFHIAADVDFERSAVPDEGLDDARELPGIRAGFLEFHDRGQEAE